MNRNLRPVYHLPFSRRMKPRHRSGLVAILLVLGGCAHGPALARSDADTGRKVCNPLLNAWQAFVSKESFKRLLGYISTARHNDRAKQLKAPVFELECGVLLFHQQQPITAAQIQK